MLAIERSKILREASRSLSAAEQQTAVGMQRLEQGMDHAFLQGGFQIDQQIPATDQIHSGKRGVGGEVLRGENAAIPDKAGNLMSRVHFPEKPIQALGRYPCQTAWAINSGSDRKSTRL